MTTKKARDFLDKELFVNRSIVTFRSLSRELRIHVNDAKNELQHYYDAVRDTNMPAVPTYLISGEVRALTVGLHSATQQSGSAMDLDLEFEEDREEMDVVLQSKVLLVDAGALDEAKSQFSRIHSVHIYSLSSSRLGDAGLVCIPSSKVHKADAQGGPESFTVVGKITGPHVKRKLGVTYNSTASSSKRKESIAQKTNEDRKPKPEPALLVSKKPEPKLTKPLVSKSGPSGVTSGDSHKVPCAPPSMMNYFQQGVKRKPRADTDLESASEQTSTKAKPSTTGGSSLKKEDVNLSEDDDSDTQVRRLGQRRLQRKSTITSDSEMSLRAMMDIDDEKVDRVSRVSKVRPQKEEEESSDSEKEVTAAPATSEGEDSDNVPIIPRKKKPRKVVPVGRNGLRKRRIIKSRTTTDAKGYIQTEDYSSYESVEEEEEVETKPKKKGKEGKKAMEPKVEETKQKVAIKEESAGKPKARSAPKPRGGAAKRGGLFNFFGPERK